MAQGNSMFSDLIKAGTFIIGSAVGGGLMGKFLSGNKMRLNPMGNGSERAVKHRARENFNIYEEQWLLGDENPRDWAEALWDVRSEHDIKRDEENNASLTDYKRWVEEAYIDWFPVGEDPAGDIGHELEVISKKKYTEDDLFEIIENDPAGDRGYDWEFDHYENYEGKNRAVFKAI